MVKMNTQSGFPVGSKTQPRAIGHRDNSHVSKILPITTLRTIDLGDKKNSNPLFSRFCAEMRVFFEVKSAPEYVHQKAGAPGSIASHPCKERKDGAPSLSFG
jgi:hypothetical protein